MREDRKTIFCDIDGTLVKHKESLHAIITETPEILDGVIKRLSEWRKKDYYIVLTTARSEGSREITKKQLNDLGIFYDQLVMGLPIGPRVLINDRMADGRTSVSAWCVRRDRGITHVIE